MSMRLSTRDWGRLLLLAALWTGTFYLVAVAERELPPLSLVSARTALAALALHIYLRASGQAFAFDAGWAGRFLVAGLINNLVPFGLIFWAQTHIASGLAAILNGTTPLFTMLIAHALTRDDRMSSARVAGIALGMAGVTAIVGTEALSGLSHGLIGQLAVLGAAFSYGCAGVYGRRLAVLPPAVAAAGMLSASALMALPLALAVDRPWTLPMPGIETAAAVLAIALLCTAAAFVVYFRILASAGAVNLMLVTLLMPAGAALLGAALLSERLRASQLAGMGLIALGLAVVDGRPWAAVRRAFAARPAPQPGLTSDSG